MTLFLSRAYVAGQHSLRRSGPPGHQNFLRVSATPKTPLNLALPANTPPHKTNLSGPVLRDTARLSQRYPRIARYGVCGVSTWPIGCDTPSPFSERFPREHTKWRCDTPPQKGYLSDTCAIPYENKANGCDTPSAILSRKGIARYGGVSRTGPLRNQYIQEKILGN